MSFLEIVRLARAHLQEQGRVSLRALRREFGLDDEALEELVEELVDVQRTAFRETNVLVWAGEAAARSAPPALDVERAPRVTRSGWPSAWSNSPRPTART